MAKRMKAPVKVANIIQPNVQLDRRSTTIETDYGTVLVTVIKGANGQYYTIQFIGDDDTKVEAVGTKLFVTKTALAKAEPAKPEAPKS